VGVDLVFAPALDAAQSEQIRRAGDGVVDHGVQVVRAAIYKPGTATTAAISDTGR
jgi:3-deoxy-D-arabino-heptulosonate 7-phosphate (DAHP) synthase